MPKLWKNKDLFFVTKQLDQANNIHRKVWVSEIELEEMNIEIDHGSRNNADTDNVTLQETNTTTVFEKKPIY